MAATTPPADDVFPWQVGVYDAHCHPTDTVASLASIRSMKARALVIMASRRQDQHLVDLFAREVGWTTTSESQDRHVVPSFGWHPWFSHQIIVDLDPSTVAPLSKAEHYQSVIVPRPDDGEFLASLPEPVFLSKILEETRSSLEKYPCALVGEIGLDRAFRIPGTEIFDAHREADRTLTPGSRGGRSLTRYQVAMDHQRSLFTAQLRLAGEMQRAVSIHGVSAHGTLHDTLAATWKGHENQSRRKSKRHASQAYDSAAAEATSMFESSSKPFPPRICLHSFSGQADALRQYLIPTVPVKVYFSFSTLVNFSSKSKKAVETIKAVPDDRILIESDLHTAGEQMDGLLEDITRRICKIKGWSLVDGTTQLAANWRSFVFG